MPGGEFRLWKSLDRIWDLDFSRGGILSSSGLRHFFALVIYNFGRSECKLDTFDHLACMCLKNNNFTTHR